MDRFRKISRILCFYGLVIVLFLFGTILGDRTVTAIAERAPVERYHTFVIDPGHGGEDGGAASCTGKYESSFNLDIAKRLDDLLHLLGYNTVMIRKTDTAVYTTGASIAQKKVSDLKERVRIVNGTSGGILLSIHQNHFPDPRYSGAQVFYGEAEGSEVLAKLLQDDLVRCLNPYSTRKCKRGEGIYLLEKANVPAVIVECGFLSNPGEEQKLSDPEYQKKLVCVITSGAAEFLRNT